MSTTTTPPSSGAKVIALIAIVLGALIAVGGVVSAAASTLGTAAVHTSSRTAPVAGVRTVDVDLSAGELRVEFADVAAAELQVTSGSGADLWTVRRDGDELVVRTPDHRFGWWGWFGRGNGSAVLRLPLALRGVDATLGLSAGSLTADGEFGRLDLDASAGRLTVRGAADDVTARLGAGQADVRLADVRSADFELSAGEFDAALTGTPPERVVLSASAGSMRVAVPRADYDVTADTSAGSFENRIGSTPGASRTISVDVSAGAVVLRPTR